MREKERRQEVLLDVLRRNRVRSQGDLLQLMRAEGIQVTQATLSRDLRSLGVTKGADGYGTPTQRVGDRLTRRRLTSLLKDHLRAMSPAASLLVLKTDPGYAGAIAAEIDGAGMPFVVGTVAGGDTVFLAMAFPGHVKRTQAELAKMAGRADLRP